MKLTPYIKKGLTVFIKDIRMMAISFIILPLALALIYGNMQKGMFEGKSNEIDAVKVDFKYDKTSEKGKILSEILSQQEVEKFIQLETAKAEYSVSISEDFKRVEIKGKDEEATQFIMLKNFVTAIINNFNQFNAIQNSINGLELSQSQKSSLMNNVMAAYGSMGRETAIKEEIVEGYRTLNSTEYYTISMFSFTSLIMLVTLAGYFYKEKKEGIVMRSLSTPSDKRNYFLGFILTAFLISLIISVVYIGINRVRGIAFTGNMIHMAVIVLMQSILCAAVVGFVIAFIKKEMTANMVMNLVLVVPSIFGGVFFYNEIIDSKIAKRIMNLAPNTLIMNSYKDLAITESLGAVQGEILAMAVLSLVLLAVTLYKIEVKWEVQ